MWSTPICGKYGVKKTGFIGVASKCGCLCNESSTSTSTSTSTSSSVASIVDNIASLTKSVGSAITKTVAKPVVKKKAVARPVVKKKSYEVIDNELTIKDLGPSPPGTGRRLGDVKEIVMVMEIVSMDLNVYKEINTNQYLVVNMEVKKDTIIVMILKRY